MKKYKRGNYIEFFDDDKSKRKGLIDFVHKAKHVYLEYYVVYIINKRLQGISIRPTQIIKLIYSKGRMLRVNEYHDAYVFDNDIYLDNQRYTRSKFKKLLSL
jgi:hypothetical protein